MTPCRALKGCVGGDILREEREICRGCMNWDITPLGYTGLGRPVHAENVESLLGMPLKALLKPNKSRY